MTGKEVHIPFLPAQREVSPAAKKPPRFTAGEGEFNRILDETMGGSKGLNFSAHARQRLKSRSITLGSEELGKLKEAVDKAAARGCRSSLLLYRDMAFVAGVPTRTIVTALDGESMKEHVFTNIDSAVVIE